MSVADNKEEFEQSFVEELRLARQMKEHYCDKNGKETNVVKTAEIIHKIGLIYRNRSPDKIALVKCAGLFNAAIVRNPSNVADIKSDLFELCQHILQQAKAKNQDADLIEAAENFKISINELRNEVNTFLQIHVLNMPITTIQEFSTLMSNKVSAIQQINKIIADKYKQIMVKLSQFCEDVMGKPPCEYTIVGMGSLARNEITPYSDFEHIIILCDENDYKSHLEYFKWFSIIFHVVVLNIQETIIPALNISTFNDKNSELKDWLYDDITPRGISFDGMMPYACKFPLGNQHHTKINKLSTELIKPVNMMLEYLSSEADLKNGYHLADILTRTCFVFGNQDIFKQFETGAQCYRNKKSQKEIIDDVQQQVKDDLNKFSTRHLLTELKSHNQINIKLLVYRSTTTFISALARIHNISANSCFDIINEMAANNKITHNTAHKLQCAVAVACEMRLKVYMEKESQCDTVVNLKEDGMENFLNIVGPLSTVKYFQTAYCLQCEVAKQLNFNKLHFYSDPLLINITIGLAFQIRELISFSKDSRNSLWDSSKFDFDACIEQLETNIKWKFNLSESFIRPSTLSAEQIKYVADYLYSADIFDEALDFYKQLLDIYRSKSDDIDRDCNIAWTNNIIGRCLNEMNQAKSGLQYLERALEIRQNITPDAKADGDIAATLNGIGWCHIDMHNYDDALTCLNQTLVIYQNITLNAQMDRMISRTLHNIGNCHLDMLNYDDALKYLHQALEIEQNVTPDESKDRGLAITRINIARCHTALQNYEKSWDWLEQALIIFQSTTLDEGIDRRMADTFNYMGECLIGKKQFKEALEYLHTALKIYHNISNDIEKDTRRAKALHNTGLCLIELQNYSEALHYLKQSRAVYKNVPQITYITGKIASINKSVEQINKT